jgi:FkbM family methyltransferase
MIKQSIRRMAQRWIGFDNYLFLFAWFSGIRMRYLGAEKEFRFFMNLLPSRGIVLDIGANIGIMTVALAKRHPAASIYAFEPMPANLKALQRITQYHRLQQIRIFPIALGDQNGLVEMVMPMMNHARMQGYSHVVEPGQSLEEGDTIHVPMRKLDEMDELQTDIPITAIKMDVENYELFVLQGAEALLRKHKPVIYCELWDDARRSACIDFLKRLGYRAMIYQENRLEDFSEQQSVNFFFLP